jgi:hypothetical protein
MATHTVPNGNFETGDFKYWKVQNFHTPACVEAYGGSYKARLVGGRSTGQLLFTRFKVRPGVFKLTFTASAPQSIKHEGSPDLLIHAFVLFIVTGFNADNVPIQSDFSLSGINPKKKVITYHGELLPEVEEVEVRFSIPSDPYANKGPVYLDNVDFIQSEK